jgi:hypothetical protein
VRLEFYNSSSTDNFGRAILSVRPVPRSMSYVFQYKYLLYSEPNPFFDFLERESQATKMLNLHKLDGPEVVNPCLKRTRSSLFVDLQPQAPSPPFNRTSPSLELLATTLVPPASTTGPSSKVMNIALFKTHKTASSTLASVLYRFAARHGGKLFTFGPATVMPARTVVQWANSGVPAPYKLKFNIAFQHLSGYGRLPTSMGNIFKLYNGLISSPRVITIVREPVSHALSWVTYMRTPPTLAHLSRLIESPEMPANTLAADFGLQTSQDVTNFVLRELPKFSLACISEQFDECLVMMRRSFNWSFLDITYMKLLDSSKSQ